jgi:SAM-dependent methyltransferase
MAPPAGCPPPRRPDRDEDRLRFLLDGQVHCDHYLTPLAEPRGKSVLVVGAGAGTEMLWCLRHGVREVVGLDAVPQSLVALEQARRQLGLDLSIPVSMLELRIEDAVHISRRFDLVLSNNCFEHVADVRAAFQACAALIEPGSGRIAIFTAPLYFSANGSHLPMEPWEHLWGNLDSLRTEILPKLRDDHPLRHVDLATYFDREISLNRMRLADFLAAVRGSDLVILHLELLTERHLAELPAYLERLASTQAREGFHVTDFAVEGIAVELMRVPDQPLAGPPESAATRARDRERLDHGSALTARENELFAAQRNAADLRDLVTGLEWKQSSLLALADERARDLASEHQVSERLRTELAAALAVLDAVAASFSHRLGRVLTSPLRAVRRLMHRQKSSPRGRAE